MLVNFTHAMISHLLTNSKVDPGSVKHPWSMSSMSCHVMSNMSCVSTFLEQQHLYNNNLLDTFQFAYKQHGDTKTALVWIKDGHLHFLDLDRRSRPLAVLLDIIAAPTCSFYSANWAAQVYSAPGFNGWGLSCRSGHKLTALVATTPGKHWRHTGVFHLQSLPPR